MLKYLKKIFLLLLIVLIIIFQLSFINSLPGIWSRLNLSLVMVVASFVLFSRRTAFLASFAAGFFLDIFSFNFFGVYTLTFILTAILSDFLLINFFTNRSIYSFVALGLLATIFFNFSLYLLIYLSLIFEDAKFFMFSWVFWENLGLELVANAIFILVFLSFYSWRSYHFKPVFLEKK